MTLDQIWAERVQGKTLADLADVWRMLLYASGGTTFYVDNVVAQ